ncbi:MAG: glycosyltransferase [Thermoanaerobaculia bacterium]
MTSGRPRVTVIVLTYNHSKFIAGALESIVTQRTSFDFEVVVLDDCSTDGTTAMVLSYARRYPDRVRVVDPGRNRNDLTMLIEAWHDSRADYITIVDGDDSWIDPARLQIQVDFLDENPECGLCFHNVEIWSEEEQRVLRLSNPRDLPRFPTQESLVSNILVRTCSAMIRRAALPFLPEWFLGLPAGDIPLFLLATRNGTAGYVDRVMARYREHPGGMWSSRSYREQLEFVLLLFDRLLGKFGIALDEEIRLMMVKRCHELAGQRESERAAAPSSEAVRAIEARLLEGARGTALRVTRVVSKWRPAELLGASIDVPKVGVVVDIRSVDIAGWALSTGSPVEHVELFRDGRRIAQTGARRSRPDVAEVFPGDPFAESCGYETSVGLPGGTRLIRVDAVTQDGDRLPVGEIHFGDGPLAGA